MRRPGEDSSSAAAGAQRSSVNLSSRTPFANHLPPRSRCFRTLPRPLAPLGTFVVWGTDVTSLSRAANEDRPERPRNVAATNLTGQHSAPPMTGYTHESASRSSFSVAAGQMLFDARDMVRTSSCGRVLLAFPMMSTMRGAVCPLGVDPCDRQGAHRPSTDYLINTQVETACRKTPLAPQPSTHNGRAR